jgi:excisionase family DNA binding protein
VEKVVEEKLDSCLTLTIAQAAKLLGISRNSAYQAARYGQLPVIKIGARLLIPRVALEEMLTRCRTKGNDEVAANARPAAIPLSAPFRRTVR